MKATSTTIILIFLFKICLSQNDTSAYNYVLNYQVPQSPAFTALGVNPTQIVRGSSAKPFVINVLTEFVQSKKIQPGIALDFIPFFVFGGQFKNINDYRNNDRNRLLANIQLSLAAVKNISDSNSTDLAGGIRITFWDQHDLLNNSELSKGVSTALASQAHALPGISDDDEIGPNVAVKDLKKIYNEIYNKVRVAKGSAFTGGYGVRSTAHNSYLVSDSLVNVQHKMWLALSVYSFIKGVDLLINFQGTYADQFRPISKIGTALMSQNKNNNMGAEAVYDFTNNNFEGGFLSEFKLFGSISALVGVSAITNNAIPEKPIQLKLNTSLKFNLLGNLN